jgi:hypothetical protein
MSGNGNLRISEASLADSDGWRQFSTPPGAPRETSRNQILVVKSQSELEVTPTAARCRVRED